MKIVRFPDVVCESVWVELHKSMMKEQAIMGSRTLPQNLKYLYQINHAILMFEEEKVVGFIGVWPINDSIVEVGSAWVHPDFRGKKIGKQLYLELNTFFVQHKKFGFAITQNPVSLHTGEYLGLFVHDDWNDPIPYQFTCGPCDWVSEDQKEHCKKRNVSCWLRVRK